MHRVWLVIAVVGALAAPATAAAADSTPLGLTCNPPSADGVRFCPGNGGTQRVPSFDGVPLDADVTLPPASFGSGPYPTIALLHGYGGSKTDFESTDPNGNGSTTYHYNNDYFASHGFAVLNYTARGFGNSCGSAASRASDTTACAQGFVRLGDQRYEARDTQYLLGVLVDEGIAKPAALGVTGISYGGGQSTELGYLRNRIRCAGPATDKLPGDPCDGVPVNTFLPWRSPDGTPLSIAAAWPRWPWSDLISALVPNGRFLDYDPFTDGMDGSDGSGSPVGVPISSFVNGLYLVGLASGFYEPVQPPFTPASEWDQTTQIGYLNAGEPVGAAARYDLDLVAAHHGGYGIPGIPSPLLMQSGWNDDLFPVQQSLRVYNDVYSHDPFGGNVSLQFGDVGHMRGSNKPTVNVYFNEQGDAFLARYLHVNISTGEAAPTPGSVTAFTTTCPSSAPDGGPFTARSWPALHPGIIRFGSAAAQTATSPGGDPAVAAGLDPTTNPNGCKTFTAENEPGTASYSTTSNGFTLMGLPTITARVALSDPSGNDAQLDARLWDVAPNGQQILITRGGYRLQNPLPSSRIVFQLHGNGYYVAPGDTVKLELLGSDSPYFRTSNGAFSLSISHVRVVLPTYEPPNGRQIVSPFTAPLPAPGSFGRVTTQGVPIGFGRWW